MNNKHPFDVELAQNNNMVLVVEELPEIVQNWSDCLSTATSFSTTTGSSTGGSFSTVGSVISCKGG